MRPTRAVIHNPDSFNPDSFNPDSFFKFDLRIGTGSKGLEIVTSRESMTDREVKPQLKVRMNLTDLFCISGQSLRRSNGQPPIGANLLHLSA
jgi:hypothetical protein